MAALEHLVNAVAHASKARQSALASQAAHRFWDTSRAMQAEALTRSQLAPLVDKVRRGRGFLA
jgi:hypothetical protein